MKKIQDMLSLAGKKTTITVSDFRSQPGEILTQAALGMEFEITKNGKVLAVLHRPERTIHIR